MLDEFAQHWPVEILERLRKLGILLVPVDALTRPYPMTAIPTPSPMNWSRPT